MPQQTQNYKLNTWLATDRFILSELNENFTKIDDQMKIFDTMDKQMNTAINSLKDKVEVAVKDISGVFGFKFYQTAYALVKDNTSVDRALDLCQVVKDSYVSRYGSSYVDENGAGTFGNLTYVNIECGFRPRFVFLLGTKFTYTGLSASSFNTGSAYIGPIEGLRFVPYRNLNGDVISESGYWQIDALFTEKYPYQSFNIAWSENVNGYIQLHDGSFTAPYLKVTDTGCQVLTASKTIYGYRSTYTSTVMNVDWTAYCIG